MVITCLGWDERSVQDLECIHQDRKFLGVRTCKLQDPPVVGLSNLYPTSIPSELKTGSLQRYVALTQPHHDALQ